MVTQTAVAPQNLQDVCEKAWGKMNAVFNNGIANSDTDWVAQAERAQLIMDEAQTVLCEMGIEREQLIHSPRYAGALISQYMAINRHAAQAQYALITARRFATQEEIPALIKYLCRASGLPDDALPIALRYSGPGGGIYTGE